MKIQDETAARAAPTQHGDDDGAIEWSEVVRLARRAREKPAAYVGPPTGPAYEMVEWLAKHPEVLDGYGFEWVAIADKQVVARGGTFSEAADAAHEQGHDDPLLVPLFPPPFP